LGGFSGMCGKATHFAEAGSDLPIMILEPAQAQDDETPLHSQENRFQFYFSEWKKYFELSCNNYL
jgi:hypothetical protein